MSFPRYPQYKDSGVEWLGEVPEHWNITRLRFVVRLNPSKSEIASLSAGTVVSVLPMEAIGNDGTFVLDREATIGELGSGYTYMRDGDIVIAKITPCYENGKGGILNGLTNGIGFGTTELIVVRPRNGDSVAASFLQYLFSSRAFRSLGESNMYGAGGQKRVPEIFVKNFAAAIPSIAEQRQIAYFLDGDLAILYDLIVHQRRLIELLKEKRQAIISHAVTKGLDPRVAMKPTGVKWLGNIPEHWKQVRLSYVSTVENGTTPSRDEKEYWTDGDIPWLSSGQVNQLRITEAGEFITAKALRECSLRVLPRGTIVVGMIGQGKTRGLAASLEIEATINQNLAAVMPGPQLDSDYLLFIFQTMYEYLREFGRGGNQAALNCEILAALRVPLPSLEEQSRISGFVRGNIARFEELAAEAGRAIELLQERRAALISAAVTGQIDVRGWSREDAA